VPVNSRKTREVHYDIDARKRRRPIRAGPEVGRHNEKNPGLFNPGSAAGGNLVTGIFQCVNKMPANEP
jgi:hypothetical protein